MQISTLADAEAWRAEKLSRLRERRVLRCISPADYERGRREIEAVYQDRRRAVISSRSP
jgi:hypothetical protein